MKKKIRDAQKTKNQILLAAEQLFAEKGYAGASLRELSEASGASGPLIVFHFKDKHGVYDAVKANIINRYIQTNNEDPPEDDSFQAFIRHLLASMFQFYRDNPTMMRLANWGRLEGETDPWPGEDKLHHAYCHRIRQAQKQGEIRDDLTPLNISVMICGAMHIWWEYHEHFIKHLAADARTAAPDDAPRTAAEAAAAADDFYFQQCLSFVLRGLSKPEDSVSTTNSERQLC